MTGYLKHALILLVTVALIALFLRQADLSAVGRELAHAHPGGVLLALLASVGTFIFRTFRWQYLLLPAGRRAVRSGPARHRHRLRRQRHAARAASARCVRPYLLARKANLDPTATFATIVLERALDIITLLLLFAVSVALLDTGFAVNDGQMLRAVQFGGLHRGRRRRWAAWRVAFLFAGHAERVERGHRASDPPAAGRASAGSPSRSWRRSGRGSPCSGRPAALALAFAWSIAVWVSIALTTWAMARAFDAAAAVCRHVHGADVHGRRRLGADAGRGRGVPRVRAAGA